MLSSRSAGTAGIVALISFVFAGGAVIRIIYAYFYRMLQRIADNFYYRNLVILLVFLSPEVLPRLAAGGDNVGLKTLNTTIAYTCFFIYFVFHNRVLYEKLLRKRRILLYIITTVTTLFIYRESTSYLQWYFIRPAGETEYHIKELLYYNWVVWLLIYWTDLVYVYIALGVYLAFKYFQERTAILQKESLQKEMELKELNAQLNPHFLFNALNNIYSHQLRSNTSGGELILKLAELMRYILDISKKQTVDLSEEIDFIENYIAFEKERTGSRCTVNYKKVLTPQGTRLAPLLLFTLIENAFKHGTRSIERSAIDIELYSDHETLKLVVTNPLLQTGAPGLGIGLNNLRRRLELFYPGRHLLSIVQDNERYSVQLELKHR